MQRGALFKKLKHISKTNNPRSFGAKEARIKEEVEIIHEAAERLGRLINPELPMIGKRINTRTGLSHAVVEEAQYDASQLFEFIGYTLVDCDIQAEELEEGVKNLIKGHFAHIKLVNAITREEKG